MSKLSPNTTKKKTESIRELSKNMFSINIETWCEADTKDSPSARHIEVLVDVLLSRDEPAFKEVDPGYAYSLIKIPADLDGFLAVAITNRFYDEDSVKGVGSYTIFHAASGKEITCLYPYPDPEELTMQPDYYTYTCEPIPMKKILGEAYVYDKEKNDFITITVCHNNAAYYVDSHEICSIAEALGLE